MNIWSSDIFLLAEKLRNEDPEQFYTLVKMHLSFVLDLNTDDCDGNSEKKIKAAKWNLPFYKKQKVCAKNSNEIQYLTPEFIAQIKPVIAFLSKEENISQEGIFRRSGKVTRQQELKLLLQQGVVINFNDNLFSVHECATVLKNVLSELPESVLTDAHYPAYCQLAEFCDGKTQANNERLLRALQLLILLLPNENRKFFQEIIELLHLAITYEHKNRMSAENLATLFTPHLLCPRKLSPEAFHVNSQVMSCIVAFMIQKGSELFDIPPTVATDVKAYWDKKERKKLSPLKQLNESIYDGTAANTVFTFVDREKTAEENRTNPTVTALAQLYAYIQALPESSKKRKLIKQFNKENGYGTPLRSASGKKRIKTLNLGDSIKKHLSGFSKPSKRNTNCPTVEGEDEEISSPDSGLYIKKVHNGECEQYENDPIAVIKKSSVNFSVPNQKPSINNNEALETQTEDNSFSTPKRKFLDVHKTSKSQTKLSNDWLQESKSTTKNTTFKPTPKRSSPPSYEENIFLSKSSRFSDKEILSETEHNSNSEKEGLHQSLVSNKNSKVISSLGVTSNLLERTPNIQEKISSHEEKFQKIGFFKDESFECIQKNSVQKLNTSGALGITNNEAFLLSSNNTNRLPISYGSKSTFLMTTSTPAATNGCLFTPIADKNNSMSPITKSTRRMPKAMQETMMTPRSRKPVISLSGTTDLCNLVDLDSQEVDNYKSRGTKAKILSNSEKKLIMEDSNEEDNHSLSSPFRNYLYNRSVLTVSPVDLSFTSRTDDFLSLSDKNSSEENNDFKSLPEILNAAELSESLLYCLDGNEPDMKSRKSDNDCNLVDCSCSSFRNCHNHSCPVYETAL